MRTPGGAGHTLGQELCCIQGTQGSGQGQGARQESFIHLQSQHLGKEVGAQIADDDVESDASAQHQPNHAANTDRDELGGPHFHPQL